LSHFVQRAGDWAFNIFLLLYYVYDSIVKMIIKGLKTKIEVLQKSVMSEDSSNMTRR